MESIRLYSYFRSSCAWRVRIALAHKAIAYELVPVHLLRGGGEQRSSEFFAKNALGQVPVLELTTHTGEVFRLTQSMAILEYLEETRPEPSLLPKTPQLRARARQLAEVVNSGVQPLQNLKLQQELRARGLEPEPLVRSFIETGLTALVRIANDSAGRYLVGDELSFADLFLVPQLAIARRFNVDLEGYPLLLRVERECEALDSFRAAHPQAQPDFEAT